MKLAQRVYNIYVKLKLSFLLIISKRMAGDEAFKLFCTPFSPVKKKTPAIINTGEPIFVEYGGLPVKGFRFNHPQAKKVLVLHGFSSSLKNFHYYIKLLVDKGYEVLAYDAPAHGDSPGKTINAEDNSEIINLFIKKYGPVNSAMAHSFGGLSICLAAEKESGVGIQKIALIAPATETTTAIKTAFKVLRINNNDLHEALADAIHRSSGKNVEWYSIKRAVKNINAKILWFQDEDDETTPLADVIKVKELNLPNVEFVITKGLGHQKIYRDEAVKNKIVEFL